MREYTAAVHVFDILHVFPIFLTSMSTFDVVIAV